MKTTFSIAAFTGLLSTASAQYFGLTSARSASDIHYLSVSASGESLWLNKTTAAYCPSDVEELGACPPGNTTVFGGGNGGLSMGVVVPGGQQVYIEAETGAVKYTIAHSAAIPEDAIVTGWTNKQADGFGILSNEKGGFVACPANATGPDAGAWEVFAALECVTFADDCLSFDALSSNTTAAGAWQYS
jgi:hypothetical protein